MSASNTLIWMLVGGLVGGAITGWYWQALETKRYWYIGYGVGIGVLVGIVGVMLL